MGSPFKAKGTPWRLNEQLIVRLRMLTEHAAPILGRMLDHDPAENDQTRSEHALVAGNLLGPLDD